jgi:hypothetical protein
MFVRIVEDNSPRWQAKEDLNFNLVKIGKRTISFHHKRVFILPRASPDVGVKRGLHWQPAQPIPTREQRDEAIQRLAESKKKGTEPCQSTALFITPMPLSQISTSHYYK